MADLNLTLTQEEREFLTGLLEIAMKETRVEEHRTRTPNFREHMLHREDVIASVLKKLGQKPG